MQDFKWSANEVMYGKWKNHTVKLIMSLSVHDLLVVGDERDEFDNLN